MSDLTIPPGWRLVPVEATRKMRIVAIEADYMRTGGETCVHIYRAMLAAAPSPPACDGWQPIETAPDDRQVLVWDGHHQRVAQMMTAIEDGTRDWVYARQLACEGSAIAFVCEPTHWRPLDAPPKEPMT